MRYQKPEKTKFQNVWTLWTTLRSPLRSILSQQLNRGLRRGQWQGTGDTNYNLQLSSGTRGQINEPVCITSLVRPTSGGHPASTDWGTCEKWINRQLPGPRGVQINVTLCDFWNWNLFRGSGAWMLMSCFPFEWRATGPARNGCAGCMRSIDLFAGPGKWRTFCARRMLPCTGLWVTRRNFRTGLQI